MRPFSPFSVVLLALLVFGCSGSNYPPHIKISREPAKGLEQADFDGAYLASLTEWTRNAAQQRLAETYERNGVPPERQTGRAHVESRYRERDGEKLAVIDLAYSGNPVRVARVVGLEGDEVVTVSCTSSTGAPIDAFDTGTACGQAVHDIFFD